MKNQCWISKAGTPAGMDEHSVDVAGKPSAFEPVELMLVGATWCKAPVRRQAMEGRVRARSAAWPALVGVHAASDLASEETVQPARPDDQSQLGKATTQPTVSRDDQRYLPRCC